YMEIPKKLAGVIYAQGLADLLCLNKNLNISIFYDGIVNLLTFLRSYITSVFGDDFRRVEHIVAKHRMNE
ncbi:hypothetical protein A260_28276, partial [Pseudomonas syringae pv. actinidiae ICMP 19068]